MTRPRTAATIKTVGQLAVGRAKGDARHVHQFRIACLELERTRRLKELAAATRALEGLRARLAEIDREITRHQDDMGPAPLTTPMTTPPPTPPAPAPEAAPRARSEAAPAPGRKPAAAKRRTLRY